MNRVFQIGRLAKDVEVRYSNDLAIARTSIAVNRVKKDEADFFNVVAFGKTAEIMEKYTRKGSQIGIVGRLQNDNYTNKDGQKVYGNIIVIDEIQLLDKKEESKEESKDTGFVDVPDDIDDLPFN